MILTNVGGLPNLLTHNLTAKLVNPNDISSMASNILQYLSDDEKRINIASNARNMIENNFNRDTIINQWYQIIDHIIQ